MRQEKATARPRLLLAALLGLVGGAVLFPRPAKGGAKRR